MMIIMIEIGRICTSGIIKGRISKENKKKKKKFPNETSTDTMKQAESGTIKTVPVYFRYR